MAGLPWGIVVLSETWLHDEHGLEVDFVILCPDWDAVTKPAPIAKSDNCTTGCAVGPGNFVADHETKKPGEWAGVMQAV